MATLNLARLESELRTFRRQKRLQYPSVFPVVWQPLAKDASLAEGALISLLGQTASDIEWQHKVLEYQRIPFWLQWQRRWLTSQVTQIELYFYVRFSLFLNLLKQTSSPSLFWLRQQHLSHYLSVAQRILPRFSPLIRAIKRSSALSQPVTEAPRSKHPSTLPQHDFLTAPEKLALDAEYHYAYLREQLYLRPQQRLAQPPSASPAFTENVVQHYHQMNLAFQSAILNETDVFRRWAWIKRQRHAIRRLKQRAKACGLRLPQTRLMVAYPSELPPPFSAPSFTQRFRTFFAVCCGRLRTFYQQLCEYVSCRQAPCAPEIKPGPLPDKKASESEQTAFDPPLPKRAHTPPEKYDQYFRQLIKRLIVLPNPNFELIHAYNKMRIRDMKLFPSQFLLSRENTAKRLDTYLPLQKQKNFFQQLAASYPRFIPFPNFRLDRWKQIHRKRIDQIKQYQILYDQWLKLKDSSTLAFHVETPQALREKLWQSLAQLYQHLHTACQAYVKHQRSYLKKSPQSEEQYLSLQTGFYTLRQLARECCQDFPVTNITPFNQQLVQWEANILNTLPRLIEIKPNDKKPSIPPPPAIPLPEEAYPAQTNLPNLFSHSSEPPLDPKNLTEVPESKSLALSQEPVASSQPCSIPVQTALPPPTLQELIEQEFSQLDKDLNSWKLEEKNWGASKLQSRFQQFCSNCKQWINRSENLLEQLHRVESCANLQVKLLTKGHSLLLEIFIQGANIFDDSVFAPLPAFENREETFNQKGLVHVEWAALFDINLEKLLNESTIQTDLPKQLHAGLMKLTLAAHFDKYANSRHSLTNESPLLVHLPSTSNPDNVKSEFYQHVKKQSEEKMNLIIQGKQIVENFPVYYRQRPLHQPSISKKWASDCAEARERGLRRRIQILFLFPRLVLQHLRHIQHPDFISPTHFPSSWKRRPSLQWILDFQKEMDEAEARRQKEKDEAEALRQKEKDEAEALRQKEKDEEEALRQKEKDEVAERHRKLEEQVQNLMRTIAEQNRQRQAQIQNLIQIILNPSISSTILQPPGNTPFGFRFFTPLTQAPGSNSPPSLAPSSSSASSSSSMFSSTTSSTSEATGMTSDNPTFSTTLG